MFGRRTFCLIALFALCLTGSGFFSEASETFAHPQKSCDGNSDKTCWTGLIEGVEYKVFQVALNPQFGDGKLHVVRIDPKQAKLNLALASQHGGERNTAADWCKKNNFVVAINAGMYQTDYLTNVGYLRHGKHMNNPKWNPKYQSALAFGPLKTGIPSALMVDLDEPGAKDKLSAYRTVIQNLRLLKGEAKNVWSKQEKKWSEAAIGFDKEGRILFLFTRTPFTMWEFNEIIKKLPLNIVRAMHVEGGPEASLSIHAGNIHLDLSGSYETGFNETDSESGQWKIPNVLGVLSSH